MQGLEVFMRQRLLGAAAPRRVKGQQPGQHVDGRLARGAKAAEQRGRPARWTRGGGEEKVRRGVMGGGGGAAWARCVLFVFWGGGGAGQYGPHLPGTFFR